MGAQDELSQPELRFLLTGGIATAAAPPPNPHPAWSVLFLSAVIPMVC
jgi:hypothetical protein